MVDAGCLWYRLMHLFMVQVDETGCLYRLFGTGLVHGCLWYRLITGCRLIGTGLQQYISQ
jgi:hypothetical protein